VGKRRTRITIETNEIVVARRIVSPVAAWCKKCETESGVVTLAQAALLCHLDLGVIEEWVRTGQLHVLEALEMGPLICIKSLGRYR
jgi:hypothetical protein